MILSPADKDVILVVGSSTSKRHFLSEDGGLTWRKLNNKWKIHSFVFHPTRRSWAILTAWTDACDYGKDKYHGADGQDLTSRTEKTATCNHMAFVTKDLGKSFSLITSYVVQIAWGYAPQTAKPGVEPNNGAAGMFGRSMSDRADHIYFSHFRLKQGDQPALRFWSRGVDFCVTEDQGKTKRRLVYKGNKFILSNNYIFVAKLKDQISQTVNLMVSSDGGIMFKPAELPEVIDEKSYTILDTSENVVILHVNHGANFKLDNTDIGIGNIYISDSEGIRYSLALAHNVR